MKFQFRLVIVLFIAGLSSGLVLILSTVSVLDSAVASEFTGSRIFSNIPSVLLTETETTYDVKLALAAKRLEKEPLHLYFSVTENVIGQPGVVESQKPAVFDSTVSPIDVRYADSPTVEDISGERISVSGAVVLVTFSIEKSRFSRTWDPKQVREGTILLRAISGKPLDSSKKVYSFKVLNFTRQFFSLKGDSYSVTYRTPPSTESLRNQAPFSKVPVVVLDLRESPEAIEGITQFEANLFKNGFDSIWEKQCGIHLDLKAIIQFAKAPQLSVSVDIAPELISLHRLATELLPDDMSNSILAVLGKPFNPSEQLLDPNLKPLDLGTIDGVAWDPMRVKEYLGPFTGVYQAMNWAPILIFNNDANTLAHEIGHIVLSQGHDANPGSLMSEGAKGLKITDEQCNRASSYLRAHFK